MPGVERLVLRFKRNVRNVRFADLRKVYEYLYKSNNIFLMKDIMKLLNDHPELKNINDGIQLNEGYLRSLEEDKINEDTPEIKRESYDD